MWHATKGKSLQALGRHQAMAWRRLACLDEAIRLDPKNAFVYGTKGRSCLDWPKAGACGQGGDTQELGRHQELTCLDRAIDLGPNYPFAYGTKGVSLQELGRHREAMACLDEAIRLDPTNAFAYGTKGKSLQDARGARRQRGGAGSRTLCKSSEDTGRRWRALMRR